MLIVARVFLIIFDLVVQRLDGITRRAWTLLGSRKTQKMPRAKRASFQYALC